MTEIALPVPQATEEKAKPKKAAKPQSKGKRFLKRLFLALLPLLLLGGAYGLAKAGIIPVEPLAKKHPLARKALGTLHLLKDKSKTATHDDKHGKKDEVKHAVEPVAPIVSPLAQMSPPPAPKPVAEEKSKPRDNATKVARVFMSMEISDVVPIVEKMSDAEAAPVLARMREDAVGEILAALPPQRALVLTRFLRRPPGS